MRLKRTWCFLVHRWWVDTAWLPVNPATPYRCELCGEQWSRP